jgi:shikimate 5-dehydrogenase/3-dehydroquinate dehydratase
MKLVVTILEETMESAIDAIRAVDQDHDWIEVRAEQFPSIDLHAVRASTRKPIILTYRNTPIRNAKEAIEAGIDLVDVEWKDDVTIDVPERTVLSHHDYEGMREIEAIWEKMLARNCAHTKLAATPKNFAENERLLALLRGENRDNREIPPLPTLGRDDTNTNVTTVLPPTANRQPPTNQTIIGMSERGLYSRVLAPFRGSAFAFVAGSNIAAPGQLTLARALDLYSREPQRADRVFAVLGNPAGHSLSPSIHNRLFREKRVPAVYTIASFETFAEITGAFLRGEPCGLSVTTPFKDEAFAFAKRINAEIGENALRAEAVNTLVNVNGRVIADNTDVDGFVALLPNDTKRAAIVGAGGTARAARVALENAGTAFTRFNRTASKADASLSELQNFDGDLIINTLPGDIDIAIPRCRVYIEAAYTAEPREVADVRVDGLELLRAQAVRQHQLFMKVFDGF